jgi:hypothetical protein
LLGCCLLVLFGPANNPNVHLADPQVTFSQYPFGLFFFSSLALAHFLDSLAESSTASREAKRVACGAVGGIIGGLSNAFAKSAVSGSRAQNFLGYLIVVGLAAACALLQIVFLNRALARFHAFRIVPIYQTVLLIAATMSGAIAFDEFQGFSLFAWIMFCAGVAVACVGVAVLASSPSLGSDSVADKDVEDTS